MKYFFLTLLITSSYMLYSQNITENCVNNVTGKVINKQSKSQISNAYVQLKLNGKLIEEVHSDQNGMFSFTLNCDARYQVSAIYENYSKSIKLVFTSSDANNHEVLMEMIPLNEFKVKDNKKFIVMEPIYFEPDDTSISRETALQLDFVSDLMFKYDQIQIEIGFHSDNMSKMEYLQTLTQKRADACAAYLINKGISSSRIMAKGYGFNSPITDCNTDAMKENKERCTKNYRTEFIVTSEIIQ